MASPVGSVYVELGLDSAEFKRGIKQAQDSTATLGRAAERAGRDFGRLEEQLNPAVRALRQYEAAQRTVANAVRTGAATQGQATAVLAQAKARYESMIRPVTQSAGAFRGAGSAIQQAGFQVGDFAVQVASGGGVLRPFIQQGTQLISMFGPWGAVIGAAGAVVGALAVSLMDAGEEAKSFEDQLRELEDTLRELDAFRDEIDGLDELKKKYDDATQAVIDLINIRRRLKREELADQAGGLTREIGGLLGGTRPDLRARLGIGSGIFGSSATAGSALFEASLAPFFAEGTFTDRAEAAREMRDRLVEAAGGMENLNSAASDLFRKLVDIEQMLRDAAATTGEIPPHMDDAADGADDMADGVGRAARNANDLTDALRAAARAMASVNASAQDRLARAQIALRFRGQPVAEARALAERDAGRIVSDVQRDIASDVPALLRPQLLAGIKADADAAVEASVQAAQVEQQLAALDAADRGGRRGGGGGGREKRDIFGQSVSEFREKLELLEHQRELIGRTESQQVRMTAAFERQRMVEEILNKAKQEGVELAPEQIAQINAQAGAIEDLTVANFHLKEELEQQAKAAEDAKKKQEELARSITTVADRLIGAVQQADSFKQALRNIGLEILRLGIQGLGGQGPLGGLLGNIIPGLLGIGSSLAPTTAPIPTPKPFAGGGIAEGWAMVGEQGRELAHFGSPTRIFSNAETERMMNGGGGGGELVVRLGPGLEAEWLQKARGQSVRIARTESQRAVGGLMEAQREYPVIR